MKKHQRNSIIYYVYNTERMKELQLVRDKCVISA